MNPVIVKTAALLVLSNCFMTFAWYGHLKGLKTAPWIVAVVASWGVAFFEYLIMVPANRLGYAGGLELGQLKIMQEVITLSVFVPFACFSWAKNGAGTTSGRFSASSACISFFAGKLRRRAFPPLRARQRERLGEAADFLREEARGRERMRPRTPRSGSPRRMRRTRACAVSS